MKYNKEADEACIAKWRSLIERFNTLIGNASDASKISKELLEIKEEAKNSGVLTQRQTECLVARVDNFIAGTYGKSKSNVVFKAA